MEAIYDDVQVTSSLASDKGHSSHCYQGLVKMNAPFEYANAGEISKQDDTDTNRSAYKSLNLADCDDTARSEYANQSRAFLLKSCSNEDSYKSDHKTSSKPKKYVYVDQGKNVSVPESSDEREGNELKSPEEIPKRNSKSGLKVLYCLVLFSTLLSVTALAVATASIVWYTLQLTQHRSEVSCLIELLQQQNVSLCAKN